MEHPPRAARTDAERFDPPLQRQVWTVSGDLGWAAFVDDARARWESGADAFDRVLWHGGLQIDRMPLDPERPPDEVRQGAQVVAWGFVHEPEVAPFELAERVLVDDGDLLVIDKPAWWTMQRTRASVRPSLEDHLRAELETSSLHAVHRLDRQTTGVAIFARSSEAARALQRVFQARTVRKRYEALVEGRPAWWACRSTGRMRRVLHPTRYRFERSNDPADRYVEARFRAGQSAEGVTRVEARPRTGRTHQLRVQLADLGHPILGDTLYGARRTAGRIRLHAAGLVLAWRGQTLALEAPRPTDLELG